MKTVLTVLLITLSFSKLLAQDEPKEYYSFKGQFSIMASAGIAEVYGGSQKSGLIPLSHIGFGYYLSNRMTVIGESSFFYESFGNELPELEPKLNFNLAINYGLAFRFLGRKHEWCPTPFIQSGVYMLQRKNEEPNLNWLISPGLLFSLHENEKLFMEIVGDFQATQLITGKPFLMAARLGISYNL